MTALTAEMTFAFICPWCLIGKRYLKKVLASCAKLAGVGTYAVERQQGRCFIDLLRFRPQEPRACLQPL